MAQRTVGHGELLKAINGLPGITNLQFRIAAMHLAHATPPNLSVYVKTETIAKSVGCTERSVQNCRSWLEEQKSVTITIGGGRSSDGGRRFTTVDFAPLAERITNPEAGFGVTHAATPKENAATPKENASTPKPGAPVYEKDPLRRTLLKDGAAAPANAGGRADASERRNPGAVAEAVLDKHNPLRARKVAGAQ